MRILFVENKPRMAALLQRADQREGYAAIVVHDGEAALAAATKYHLGAMCWTSCSRS